MSLLVKQEVVVDHVHRVFQVQVLVDYNLSCEDLERYLEDYPDEKVFPVLGDAVVKFDDFIKSIEVMNRFLSMGYRPVGRGTREPNKRLTALERMKLGDKDRSME